MNIKELKLFACEFLGVSLEEFSVLVKNNWKTAIDDWNKYGYQEYDKNTLCNVVGLVDFCDNNRVDRLIYPIKDETGLNILDFGGGIGVLSVELASKGNNVYYYDLPSKTQDFARYIVEKTNSNVKFVTRNEIDAMVFDVVVITDVLEHIKNPMDVVIYLHSLLHKGGLFLTTGLAFSSGPNNPMHLQENQAVATVYNRYMQENFDLMFFHLGDTIGIAKNTKLETKEMVFLWKKK